MRTIDELGISKTPWAVGRIGVPRCIISYDNKIVATERVTEHGDANARLIAAAPELYECLCEAIHQTCLYCKYKKCNECKVVNKWKDAITKAGGEEVK